MKLSHASTGRVSAIASASALAFCLAGCSDFSQHRFGGVREIRNDVASAPKPAPALNIPNPPAVAGATSDGNVKPATFVPQREAPLDPNLQGMNHPLRVLYLRAAQRYASVEGYTFRMRRREVVNGKKQPEELVAVKVRKEPFSVHLKWVGVEGQGREAIYVRGKFKNEMQLLLASGDIFPFSPAMRYTLSPDDSTAKAKSRYPITETGFGALIERYGQIVTAVEKGDTRLGTAKYLGQIDRPEFQGKVEAVHQILPVGSDPSLPKGGERWWYFDATTGLPALVIAHDPSGEVEYYCYDNIIWPASLSDDDFNPDRLWRRKSP